LDRLGKRGSVAVDGLDDPAVQALSTTPAIETEDAPSAPVHWGRWRIDLMERLWGKGFLLPGGTDFVHQLTKPLSLGTKASVLVLDAGMGGPANLIAKEFGAFIDGIEPDPELAAASAKRAAVVKGMSRVTIKNLAIDDDAAFERKYDAIFGQEILLGIADKAKLLEHCVNALKDTGKLVITDFTLADGAAGEAVELWLQREQAKSPILTEAEWRKLFKDSGFRSKDARFRMRTVEDMSDRYVDLVLSGWVALEESLRANAADRDTLRGMIAEAERWALRVTLLKSGLIRYTRLFATRQKRL
jgi:SAM-dependent methyltransferase